jgi:hypothetical protein
MQANYGNDRLRMRYEKSKRFDDTIEYYISQITPELASANDQRNIHELS